MARVNSRFLERGSTASSKRVEGGHPPDTPRRHGSPEYGSQRYDRPADALANRVATRSGQTIRGTDLGRADNPPHSHLGNPQASRRLSPVASFAPVPVR